MARLTLVPGEIVEAWRDAELEAFYRDAYKFGTPPPTSLAIESHAPEMMRAWVRFWWTTFHHGVVDHGLKEVVRISIARRGNCDHCANLRSATAKAQGVTEAEIQAAINVLPGTLAKSGPAAEFAVALTTDHTKINASHFAELRKVFSASQVAELVAFCAWQFAGSKMISAWKTEDYREKNGRPIALHELPVRLAYDNVTNGNRMSATVPNNDVDASSNLLALVPSDSPLARWINFLSAQTEVQNAWCNLYIHALDRGSVDSRIKHLIRVRLSQLLDYPEWAPPADRRLVELGIGPDEFAALRSAREGVFSRREAVALDYAEMMCYGAEITDEVFDPLAAEYSEPDLVEIGFAVSAQQGVMRVCKALDTAKAW